MSTGDMATYPGSGPSYGGNTPTRGSTTTPADDVYGVQTI
jgi:hypothetical protein